MGVYDFFKHLSKTGLTDEEFDLSRDLIRTQYGIHGREWFPENCHRIPLLVNQTNDALTTEHQSLFAPFNALTYADGRHFALGSQTKKGLFIFDPTGIPEDFSPERRTMHGIVFPYFGLASVARNPHKQVYQEMKPHKI